MGNVVAARVSIRGTRPLLWHHFGPDALPLGRQEKAGVAGNDPTEWRRTVLVDKDGRLYLEPTQVFGCIRDGAKYTPKKRGTLQPLVAATLQIVDDRVFVDRYLPGEPTTDPTQPVYLDVRSVRNPSTRARNVRYRVAASPGWKAMFTIMWDVTIVSRGEMEAAIVDAGRFVGIGDGRSIGFGRFVVEKFEVLEDAEAATA